MNAFTAGKTKKQGRTIQRKDNSRILLKLDSTCNTHTHARAHTHRINATPHLELEGYEVNLIISINWEKLNTIATLIIVWIILDII